MHDFITTAKENSKLNMWNILTVHNQTMLYTHTKSQFCTKRSLNLFLEKEDSLGFWIPCHGFHTLSAKLGMRTSNRFRDPGFLELYSGFQSPRFRIPQAKISQIFDSKTKIFRIGKSGLPYMWPLVTLLWFLLSTDWISYDGKHKSNMESIQNGHPRRCKKKPFVTIYNGLMSVCQFFLSYFRTGVIKKLMVMMMILIKKIKIDLTSLDIYIYNHSFVLA